MEDWEKLANGLDIGRATINNINENCIHRSTTVAECRRRELVVACCDRSSSGDSHRVALDIALILDEMGQSRQAWMLRQQCPTVCRKLYKITGIYRLCLGDCMVQYLLLVYIQETMTRIIIAFLHKLQLCQRVCAQVTT